MSAKRNIQAPCEARSASHGARRPPMPGAARARGLGCVGFLLLGLGVLAVAPATPARAASATASVSVEIVPAIQVTRVADLSFGRVQAGEAAGTVVLTPNGSRTATGSAALAGTDASPAAFTVSGARDAAYSLSLPAGVTLNSGSASMSVADFTADAAAGRLDDTGTQTVRIGATLVLGERQPLGTYQGSFTLTVAYN